MTEPSSKFIKEEAVPTRTGLLALNWRLFTSLPLFLGLLPLSIATILLSSAAPSVFRWYSGSFASGGVGFTLGGLVAITALAIACQAGLASLFVALGTFNQIIAFFIFITVCFIGLTVAAVFVLRRKTTPTTFKAPGYPLTPIVFLVLVTLLLFLLAARNPLQALLGVGVVALGWPVYQFIFKRRVKRFMQNDF